MSEQEPNLKSVGYDDLLEDVFGLNIRGFKSLWASFKNPRPYYAASYAPDWQGKFTPSFRLWFTLIALTLFFQFFWAGSSSSTIESYAASIEAGGSLPEGLSSKVAAVEFARWNFGFIPFTLAFSLFCLAAIYPFWGEKLSFVMRQRKLFLTVIPSTFVGIFGTLAFGFVESVHVFSVVALTFGVALILDGITAFRGAFSTSTFGGRLWRTISLSMAIAVTGIAASALASLLAVTAISIKYS